ncbi:hypothetical protein [uncultured Tateyamaria sp.]|uniref:hypothetical protein n=1 Tax=uncultured Tateyamaria sp. TaxID=455651 RepID=UPI00261C0D12|nr:hypothetical protein [uncultured Tateyamaria sp.]
MTRSFSQESVDQRQKKLRSEEIIDILQKFEVLYDQGMPRIQQSVPATCERNHLSALRWRTSTLQCAHTFADDKIYCHFASDRFDAVPFIQRAEDRIMPR